MSAKRSRSARGSSGAARVQVRRRTKPTVRESAPTIKVTVATSPQRDGAGAPTLQGDLELVKGAVLYADKVELAGLAPSLIHAVGIDRAGRGMSAARLMKILQWLDPATPTVPRADLAAYQSGRASPAQRATIKNFVGGAQPLWDAYREELLAGTAGVQLVNAISRGVVTIADLGFDRDELIRRHARSWNSSETSKHVLAWAELLIQRANSAGEHLIFDQTSGQHFEEFVDLLGHVSMHCSQRAAVGSGLVARLPTVPVASLDEVLDVRADVQPALTAYRRVVNEFSRELAGVRLSEREEVIADLWHSRVAPDLEVLRETIREHGLMREVGRHLTNKSADVGMTTCIGVAVSLTANVQAWVAGLIASAPLLAPLPREVTQALREAGKNSEGHDLYFLHMVDSQLSNWR